MFESTDAAPLRDLLDRLHAVCRRAEASYAIVGGVAVLVHGGQRSTADLDISLGLEPERIDAFLAHAENAGFQLDPPELRDRFKHQMVRLWFRARRGPAIKVDVQLAVLPHTQLAIDHRRRKRIGDRFYWFAGPEAIVALKLIAARPRDLLDAAFLLGGRLDRELLDRIVARWKLETVLAEAVRLTREPPG